MLDRTFSVALEQPCIPCPTGVFYMPVRPVGSTEADHPFVRTVLYEVRYIYGLCLCGYKNPFITIGLATYDSVGSWFSSISVFLDL